MALALAGASDSLGRQAMRPMLCETHLPHLPHLPYLAYPPCVPHLPHPPYLPLPTSIVEVKPFVPVWLNVCCPLLWVCETDRYCV